MKLNRKGTALILSLILVMLVVIGCSSNTNTGNSGNSGNTGNNAAGNNSGSNAEEEQWEEVTVRFSEVIRSIFYGPHYIAAEKGFFKEEGLNVDLTTAQGSDKGAAALLAGTADISLIGPEAPIYIFNQEGSTKIKIFHQLTKTEGSFMLSREKIDNFNWSMLEGKRVIGWRPGSAPNMVLNHVLNKHGVTNVDVATNIAAPAMVGAFSSGDGDFIQVYEPLASMLNSDGTAYIVDSMGTASDHFPTTSFVATDEYIKENPEVIKRWSNAIQKATKWMLETDPMEVGKALAPYFEGTSDELLKQSVERYISQGTWTMEPEFTQANLDLVQQVLIENDVLKEEEKVQLSDIFHGDHLKDVIR